MFKFCPFLDFQVNDGLSKLFNFPSKYKVVSKFSKRKTINTPRLATE